MQASSFRIQIQAQTAAGNIIKSNYINLKVIQILTQTKKHKKETNLKFTIDAAIFSQF